MAKKLSPWEAQLVNVKSTCDLMGLEPAVYEVVSHPKAVLKVALPLKMDDGSVKTYEGVRIHHNDARGPTKGGIRYYPQIDMDTEMAPPAAPRREASATTPRSTWTPRWPSRPG